MPRLLVASFSVCPAPDRHGVQLANLLQALAPRFDTDVVTLRVGDLPFVDRFARARMLRVPVGGGSLVGQAEAFGRALKRQLEGEDYDLIHLRSAWGARAVIERALPSLPLVWDVAQSLEGEPAPADAEAGEALAAEEAALVARADAVFVPTETAGAHLRERGFRGRVFVVPAGVDADRFDVEPHLEEEPAWLRAADPAPREAGTAPPARILFAGRIVAGAGVRLLIRAVSILKDTRDVQLVLAGPVAPEFREVFEDAITAAEIRRRVVRLGAIQHADLPRVIAQATVCVAPCAPDRDNRPLAGCPTKVLEYLACRAPVVAPRRPAIEEVIRDGRDGLLFAPDDAEDLARALARLVDDAALRESLAESGYWMVRARFPASAARRRLLEAYARLVPPSTWMGPARAPEPIGAMPARLDSTTARFQRIADEAADYAAVEIRGPREDATPVDPRVDERATTGRHRRAGETTRRRPVAASSRSTREDELRFVAVGPLLGDTTARRRRRARDEDDTPC